MVTWSGILLLVAGLVLLVDNHQAETLEGQEHCTARTKDDIIGMRRELLLPDLHALGIAVFGVVDAQTVAEDTLQAIHHLYGEGYLRQEVEHLLLLLQRLLDKVDIYFGLTAGGDAVEQGDVLLEEGELYLVVSILLGKAEGFDTFGMGLAAVVQASHLLLKGLEESTFDEGGDGGEGVALVQQFVTGNTREIIFI